MWVGSFLDRWDERQAAEDDGNKVLDPFVVGASLAFSDLNKDAPLSELAARVARQMRFSDAFFATGPTASNYSCKDDVLTFASDLTTETVSNNEVFARLYAARSKRKAIVVLPHWNAPMWAYQSFCRNLSRLGISAVEMVLPYHGRRN